MAAVAAFYLCRNSSEIKLRLVGDGVLAQEIKVELDAIVYDAGHLANNQIYPVYLPGVYFFSFVQGDVYHLLGNTEFVHGFNTLVR